MTTPLLTATPGAPPTYNPSMAETFSWIPVEGAGRPLFAQATYLANPEDIKVSLSAGNINVSLDQLELNTDEIEGLVKDSNTRLDVLTAVDYSTEAKQDVTNSLLNILTGDVLDIENLLNSGGYVGSKLLAIEQSTNFLSPIYSNTSLIPNIVGSTNNIDFYTQQVFNQTAGINQNATDIRNSLFNGIGGFTLGGYINSYNLLLSSIDVTLRNGLNVTGGGGGTFSDAPVKKLATDTLVSTFTAPSASRVYNIFGVSTANVGQYLQIYDIAGSTPTGTPAGIFFVPANSNFNFEFVKGMPLTNNKALIVNSITPVDYNGGNSDLFLTVIYN
jgi:hypothetical protein